MMPKRARTFRERRVEANVIPVDQRGSASARGYTSVYRRLRQLLLNEGPVCVMCGVRPSTEIDHRIPLAKGGSATDPENCRPVCHECHEIMTANLVKRGKNAL